MNYRWCLLIVCVQISCQGGEIQRLYEKVKGDGTNQVLPSLGFPAAPSTNHGITEIGIERTGCFGSCPVYTCIVRSDGFVRYTCVAHVKRLGNWEARLDPYIFHRTANFIVISGYLGMRDEFTVAITDGDTVYTMITRGKQRKVFSNYANSGPDKLWVLQRLIDGMVSELQWTKVDDQPKDVAK